MKTIKSKITLITIFAVALLIFLIFLITSNIHVHYRELEMKRCRTILELERSRLENTITQFKNSAVELAAIGSIFHRTKDRDTDLARAAIIEFFQNHSYAVGGGIWYAPWQLDHERERVCFSILRTGNAPVIDEALEGTEYDYLSQQWYIEIMRQLESGKTKTAWTSPYIDEAGAYSPMVTVGAGIFDVKGKLVGLSTLDLQLEDLARHISSIRPTPGSFTLFADLDDDYIFALSDSYVTENPIGQSLSTIPWLNKLLTNNDTSIIHRDREYLSFTFKGEQESGIFFVINVPEDELFENIERHFRYIVLLLIVGCAVITLINWLLLNRFINKPLDYLSQKAVEIEAGNLTPSIRMDTREELGNLSMPLEHMTADMREYIHRFNMTAAEVDVAAKIQASMLPSLSSDFTDRSEFDIFASMSPAKEIGGDFYDFFMLDDDRLAILVADVSDKGMPAVLFMVETKTLIRNFAFLNPDLEKVFTFVNDRLCENNKVGMFVTAFMVVLNLRTGAADCVNAGHNPPCIRLAGVYDFLEIQPGFVLGAMENMRPAVTHLQLNAGDCIFLYTDGVTEAENTRGEFFGNERLLETLNRKEESFAFTDASAILGRVEEELRTFSTNAPQYDDITLLCLVYQPDQHAE